MDIQQFWLALSVLINNFHAVNRKVFACLIDEIFKIDKDINHIVINTELEINYSGYEKCTETDLKTILESASKDLEGLVVKQKLLSKKFQQNINVISLLDFTANCYLCRFLNCDLDDFSISFCDGNLNFQALTRRNKKESSERWLEYVLKPKFLNWASTKLNTPAIKSLQLLNVEAYNDLYKELKLKYSENLKQIWLTANESTDPLKFIYEDLAIAAYLICLWRSTNVRKPTAFADLGCGNGLLVNVLNEEGYCGYGYDLRKRKLWSLYATTVQAKLFETAIVPDDENSFAMPQEVNWLIGNHSDELSAWLPVLATLNSFETSYFLLPCCAYELSGAKFQRRNAKLSTYQDFFSYARKISQKCGFQTLEDRLKIPSTKRLALIGCLRSYATSGYFQKCIELKEYVAKEIQQFPHAAGVGDVTIKIRAKEEPVKNCTKIDQEIITKLINKIFKLLLNAEKLAALKTEDNIRWHAGGQLSLTEIVEQLSSNELQQLKTECGGVKTLLRNKHEVFQFHENGFICLRKPKKREQPQQIKKRRICYFHEHHPDGCPLKAIDCSFLHPNEI